MKIVVLAGGISPERDVSLSSGALIAGALTRRGHQALLLDLCFGADARGFDAAYAAQARNTRSYAVPDSEPDLDALRAAGARRIGKNVVEICADADVVFLALHGDIGENGMLQALFAIHGIRHTGTGYAGSLLAMDKTLTKQLLRETGILTPAWRTVDPCCGSIPEDTPYPCVVKPCGCGSSVGVSIVDTPAQLAQAVDRARKYEQTVLIEEKIEGREFSVGVLDGQGPARDRNHTPRGLLRLQKQIPGRPHRRGLPGGHTGRNGNGPAHGGAARPSRAATGQLFARGLYPARGRRGLLP